MKRHFSQRLVDSINARAVCSPYRLFLLAAVIINNLKWDHEFVLIDTL